ncbi:MAG: DsbA family oxidoreductase [Actinomycetota bacterium]|nr:DsbA family oxidoreductase [Actinomycetota bacterium]
MKVEIWSDIVCPWCYIGKRRVEAALAAFPHRDSVEVVWRSFELDPYAPRAHDGDPADRLAAKYGMSRHDAITAQHAMAAVAADEGLDFHLTTARSGSSFDAHRLVHLAAQEGRQDHMKERLFAAYLVDEQPIGDPGTLLDLAEEVGVDRERAEAVLAGDAYGDAVRADEAEAMEFGISAVPYFVIDRTFGVSGAQPVETLEAALNQAWEKSQLIVLPSGEAGGACNGDNCVV